MASGKPDWNRVTTIQGLSGSDFVPIKVDANGQMYIALTGQSIGVNNHPSDYFKADEAVEVNNHPSDYFKASEAIGSITNNVTVEQDSTDRVIKGVNGGSPHYIAVDTNGVLLARMKGAYSAILKDISVDATGIMLARLKGYDGSALKDVLVDSSGKIISSMQGAIVDEEILHTICDCGDDDPDTEWEDFLDLLAPTASPDYRKVGVNGIKFLIDASLTGSTHGYMDSTTDRGDLTLYIQDWVYFWFYVESLDHILASGNALTFDIGNDVSNRYAWGFTKAELQQGWNLIKCDLKNPDTTAGSIDWTDIDFMRLAVYETDPNTVDIICAIDSIQIVRRAASQGTLVDLAVNEQGRLQAQMSGDFSGQLKPIAVDASGIMKANITAQDLTVLAQRPDYGTFEEDSETGSGNTPGDLTVFSFTGGYPGVLHGGYIWITAVASYKTGSVKLVIDGVTSDELTFEKLDAYKLKAIGTHLVYSTFYDDTAFKYAISYSPGITFNTSLQIILGRIAVEYTLNAGVFLSRHT